MSFVNNFEQIARDTMTLIEPALVDAYVKVMRCFAAYPELACKPGGKDKAIGTQQFIVRQAHKFSRGRAVRSPSPPKTVADPLVSVILGQYFEVERDELDRARREHSFSMAAENFVGELLERYLAVSLESRGWTWCSGNVANKIDFIKEPPNDGDRWQLLQVKNRSNSENSSSSSVRDGTPIEKWYRIEAKTGHTNWQRFPDAAVLAQISEANFRAYVTDYRESTQSIEHSGL